ncbi:MAG: ribonuclease Z [Bacteroidaceae bacterium]|nr:ribonuclease Z [Bacteroidaceae bacterium]
MEEFEVKILGCGSALPTTRHASSSQLVLRRGKEFMIDCGEGTQLQMRYSRQGFARLGHIFISHLHGDHCFGLIGLISTLGMLGRGHAATLHIHAFPELETLLRPQIDFFCKDMEYEVEFHPFAPDTSEVIYEDRSLTVTTIPLCHRVPSSGFLFREKPSARHIRREMIDFYHIPVSQINCIKNGADFELSDGSIVPNDWLTTDPSPSRSYAYCCDTAPRTEIIPLIEGVDVLYHDATFQADDLVRAKKTFHSTSVGAATIAAQAGVKRLILGHFSARYDDEKKLLEEARSVFPATELATEGLSIQI